MAAAWSMQVGGGCRCSFGGRRAASGKAVRRLPVIRASAAKVEEEEKVRLGESSVAVSKLGIGAWSWGDTTYWNDSEWDGQYVVRQKVSEINALN